MKYLLSSCAASLCFALSNTAYAQNTDQTDSLSDEIIVTGQHLYSDQVNALKTPTPIIDVPQSLSITTAEQILEQGFDSISCLLYTSPSPRD